MDAEARKRINTLKWLLVDAIYDLVAAATVYRNCVDRVDYDLKNPRDLAVVRMCNAHVIISLAKLQETLSYFGKDTQDLPQNLKTNVNRLRDEIRDKPVLRFRNSYVAHSFDKEQATSGTMLQLEKGQDLLHEIIGFDLTIFYDWVCPIDGSQESGFSVVTTITELKEYCRQQCSDPRP